MTENDLLTTEFEPFGLKVHQQLQYSPPFFGSQGKRGLDGHILQISDYL